jgi:hypothetical protein
MRTINGRPRWHLGARQPEPLELPKAVSTRSQAPRSWTWPLILGALVTDNGLARHASFPPWRHCLERTWGPQGRCPAATPVATTG